MLNDAAELGKYCIDAPGSDSWQKQNCFKQGLPHSPLSHKVSSMKRGNMLKVALYTAFFALGSCLLGAGSPALAAGKSPPAQLVGNTEHGESIFKSICIHCHRTDYEDSVVGAPGLRDVLDRHDEAWLFQWIKGPAAFAEKDEKAKALTQSNPYGLVMPTIPEMQDAQNRRDIIAFLKTLTDQ